MFVKQNVGFCRVLMYSSTEPVVQIVGVPDGNLTLCYRRERNVLVG